MIERHFWKQEEKKIVICPHCKKKIVGNPILMGFSTLCPYCKKPY